MKELIAYLIEEINNGAGASLLLVKLEMLQRIAERCPSYYMDEIVRALKEDNNAE